MRAFTELIRDMSEREASLSAPEALCLCMGLSSGSCVCVCGAACVCCLQYRSCLLRKSSSSHSRLESHLLRVEVEDVCHSVGAVATICCVRVLRSTPRWIIRPPQSIVLSLYCPFICTTFHTVFVCVSCATSLCARCLPHNRENGAVGQGLLASVPTSAQVLGCFACV